MASDSKPIVIDISQVLRLGKQTHPHFLSLYASMENGLAQKSVVWATCIHEAEHSVYFRRAGVTDFDFYPPTIIYDAEKDKFNGSTGSTRPKSMSINALGFDVNALAEFILRIARGCVAGGIATLRMTTKPAGDEDDYTYFCMICGTVKVPGFYINCLTLWKSAQDDVWIDLQSPAAKKEICLEARRIEPLIFNL